MVSGDCLILGRVFTNDFNNQNDTFAKLLLIMHFSPSITIPSGYNHSPSSENRLGQDPNCSNPSPSDQIPTICLCSTGENHQKIQKSIIVEATVAPAVPGARILVQHHIGHRHPLQPCGQGQAALATANDDHLGMGMAGGKGHGDEAENLGKPLENPWKTTGKPCDKTYDLWIYENPSRKKNYETLGKAITT